MALAGCSNNGERVAMADSADAGGIDIRASSSVAGDSLRVTVRLTNNLDTSADITLNGGCPITVVAYSEEELLWDEREQRECEDPDIAIPLAPHEVKVLSHSVVGSADPALQSADQVGVRVLVAVDEEYMLEAGPR